MGKFADWWANEVAETKIWLRRPIEYPLWTIVNIVAFCLFVVPWQVFRYDVISGYEAIMINLTIPVLFFAFGYLFPNKIPQEEDEPLEQSRVSVTDTSWYTEGGLNESDNERYVYVHDRLLYHNYGELRNIASLLGYDFESDKPSSYYGVVPLCKTEYTSDDKLFMSIDEVIFTQIYNLEKVAKKYQLKIKSVGDYDSLGEQSYDLIRRIIDASLQDS